MSKIREFLVRLKFNLIITVVTSIILILPDFISKNFTEFNQASLNGRFIVGVVIFSFLFSFVPRILAYFIFGFFLILEIIQFCHLFYYNSLITANKFALLFDEFDEVLEVVTEAIGYLYLVPMIVIIPYTISLYLFKRLDHFKVTSWLMSVLVIIMLGIIPKRVNEAYKGVNYYPDPADHSLRNSLYAFTNFVINKSYPATKINHNYLDYVVKEGNYKPDKVNVILIIGESVNPRYMSLFGYNKLTTPKLDSLKNDSNFYYSKAISSGVNTIVSVPLLLNGIYEPNNFKALEERPVNLFKLAKKHNFKNYYISAQSGSLLANVDAEYIDKVIFRQKSPAIFNAYQDEALIKIVSELEFSDKNFIVLHQRNIHAPYESNYKHNPAFANPPLENSDYNKMMVSTYENSIRYEDFLLYNMIDFFRKKFSSPTYIFFTPDHGEGIGFNDIYGHSELKEEIYNVMFLGYVSNGSELVKDKLASIRYPLCHYEIHNLIANVLGYEIENKNYKIDICYVQGSNLYSNNEFIEYKKLP